MIARRGKRRQRSFLGAYGLSTCDSGQERLCDQSDLSLELRLASNEDDPFNGWVGGSFFDIHRHGGVSLNCDGGCLVTQGLLQIRFENRTHALAYDDFDSPVYAIFGSAIIR